MTDEDKVDIMKRLLEMDEGETLDFKEWYPLETRSERKELAKDLCALANTSGGYIVVGVRDGTWERVGIDPDAFDKDRIHQVVSTSVSPHIPFECDVVLYDGLHYGLISIDKTHLVHCLQDNTVYIRDNTSNIPANPQTIARLTIEFARWFHGQLPSVPDPSSVIGLLGS